MRIFKVVENSKDAYNQLIIEWYRFLDSVRDKNDLFYELFRFKLFKTFFESRLVWIFFLFVEITLESYKKKNPNLSTARIV